MDLRRVLLRDFAAFRVRVLIWDWDCWELVEKEKLRIGDLGRRENLGFGVGVVGVERRDLEEEAMSMLAMAFSL